MRISKYLTETLQCLVSLYRRRYQGPTEEQKYLWLRYVILRCDVQLASAMNLLWRVSCVTVLSPVVYSICQAVCHM